MKAYFKRLNSSVDRDKIENKQIDSYRTALVTELKKQDATESEIGLISDAVIINSINAGRSPKAAAWAILQ